jgi:hypothetical protein
VSVLLCATCGNIHDDGNADDLTQLPDCYRLPDDPDTIRDDLTDLIAGHIDRHPRSLQVKPGPSELGTPCSRRLGYKMLGTAPVNTDRAAAWKPVVGTAVHAWLEQACRAYNDTHRIERFYLEQKVTVGQLGEDDIKGSCDVYDRARALVIDWKIVGVTALKRYRIEGPGEQYRAQAHLYGRGFALLGLPVERVAIVLLPQNGELSDMHVWSEPYDEQVALAALDRANGIKALTTALGTAALPLLPTADAFCSYCPYRMPAATDLTEACPGHLPSPAAQPAALTAPAA